MRAAGILFVHQGRVLLLKRTDGRWGLPGGKAEQQESPAACARREFEEECGGVYPGALTPWFRLQGEHVDFRTFIAYPSEEFEPQLNEEHSEWRWAGRHELPPMLHPGLIPALQKLWPQMAKDAKPKTRRPHPLQPPEKALRPIPINEGIRAAYRRKIDMLLTRMRADLDRALKRTYPKAAAVMAHDERDPMVVLQRAMRKWSKRWVQEFDAASDEIAYAFASQARMDLDARFRKRLREAGFTVKFKPTKRMTAAFRAISQENVNLIKSIPRQYLTQVNTIVNQGVMRGMDMHEISKQLREKFGSSFDRSALIARDQSAKARAVFEEARRVELGITEAIWHHSHAGEKPRPTHVQMDGKRYNVRVGMWDPDPKVKAYIWPGTLINCRCSSRSVLPGMDLSGTKPPQPHHHSRGPGKVDVGAAIIKSKLRPKKRR